MGGEGALKLCDGGHGTDAPVGIGLGDAVQIAALVEKDRCGDVAELFGDPEADVCGPCDQGGVGGGGVEFGEIIGRLGRCPVRPLGRTPRSFLCKIEKMWGDGVIFGRLGRADDGGVSGAAAQVSGEGGVVVGVAVEVGGGHAHDKAGGAKAALAAVVGD